MRAVKRIGGVIGLVLLACALVLGTMRLGWWNPSYAEVLAKQATPPSQFVKVGTANIHLRDEGSGPVVVMLHSSMTNLREWDAWAELLKTRYRVIRFDWPPYGLSTDSAPSTGMPGVVELMDRLMVAKGIDRFSIVSTSSGATISVLYTALHPEKVEALALSTLPLKAPPPTKLSPLVMATVWLHENVVPNYYPRWYYRQSLAELYGRPENLREDTVDWYYETNNLPGGFARVRQYYQANLKAVWAKGAGDQAAKVRVPILLQWGDRDPVIPLDRADEAVRQFANARVTLIHYPDAGHYPMLEIPGPTGRDLLAFLDRVHAAPAPVSGPAAP
jgi:pimeloyl-ACP methyl ester carboxylesterase